MFNSTYDVMHGDLMSSVFLKHLQRLHVLHGFIFGKRSHRIKISHCVYVLISIPNIRA